MKRFINLLLLVYHARIIVSINFHAIGYAMKSKIFFVFLTNCYKKESPPRYDKYTRKKKKKNFFSMNRNGQIIRIPARTKEIRKTKNLALGHPPGNRPLIATSNGSGVETWPNLRFRFTGRREKWRGRGEGIDYWSLCQANAISRIDAIHASRGCKHRSTVNDEFFAGFSRPERDENSLSLARIFVDGTIWRSTAISSSSHSSTYSSTRKKKNIERMISILF